MSGIELLIVIGLRYNGLKIEADSANLQLIYIYIPLPSHGRLWKQLIWGIKQFMQILTETF